MTTQQIETLNDRPLSDVDEVAERVQASTAEQWDGRSGTRRTHVGWHAPCKTHASSRGS